MRRLKSKQPKKSGNWIQIEYETHRFDDKGSWVNDLTVSLKPTSFDYNSLEPWKWEGQDWDNKEVWVTCAKGTTSSIIFSDDFPWELKDEAQREVERILRQFN